MTFPQQWCWNHLLHPHPSPTNWLNNNTRLFPVYKAYWNVPKKKKLVMMDLLCWMTNKLYVCVAKNNCWNVACQGIRVEGLLLMCAHSVSTNSIIRRICQFTRSDANKTQPISTHHKHWVHDLRRKTKNIFFVVSDFSRLSKRLTLIIFLWTFCVVKIFKNQLFLVTTFNIAEDGVDGWFT